MSYTAMGDSISEGYGDDAGGFKVRSWTAWVADGLTSFKPDLSYSNIAQRDSTTADVIRDQLPIVQQTRPQLVSVTVGGNDARRPDWTTDSFGRQFADLIRGITGTGATTITFAYPDMRPAIHGRGQEIPTEWQIYFDRLHATNEIIRSTSADFDAYLLDFEHFEPAQQPQYLSRDLTHPNAIGYKVAGETIFKLLTDHYQLTNNHP